jgi:hypothetical protein
MSRKKISEPKALACGRIPTLNQRGFTTDFLDPISEQFSEYAAEINSKVLDIGCAYGVAVKRVLKAGGRICACDMDKRHLDVLLNSVDPANILRLRCIAGILPDVDFAECTFGRSHRCIFDTLSCPRRPPYY